MADNSQQSSDRNYSFWNQHDSLAHMQENMMRRMDNLQRDFDRLSSASFFGDFWNGGNNASSLWSFPRRFFGGNNNMLLGENSGGIENVNAATPRRNTDMFLWGKDNNTASDMYRPRSFFHDFLNRRAADDRFFSSPSCIPRMDMTDEQNHYLLQADMPGMNKENVKVNVKDGMLNITGVKKEGRKEEGRDYVMQERCGTKFFRSVQLPENVKADEIKANFKDNGTLNITIPKNEAAQLQNHRSINIE